MTPSLPARMVLALSIPFVASALQWLLWPYLSPFVWLAFFPAVFLSARIGGLWGGIASTVLSTLLAWYFFIPRQLSWQLENINSLYSMLMFLLFGYVTSLYLHRLASAEQIQQQQSAAHWNQQTLQQTMLNSLVESVLVFSLDGEILACNLAAEVFFGMSLDKLQEILRLNQMTLMREDGTPCPQDEMPVNRSLKTKKPCRNVTLGYVDSSGRVRWLLTNSEPVIDPVSGAVSAVVLSLLDIGEQKKAADEQLRLNRTLRAYSASDWALVHASDENTYIAEVCRILVEQCNYVMAWVGLAEQDPEKSVRPVAKAGRDAAYLDSIRISWEDNEYGNGPTGLAIRTGQKMICHHILTNPDFSPWREQALQRGYAASIALPLIAEGQILGALMIYSALADPFVDDELSILQELANDLAYGISVLRVRVSHANSEEALRASEQRYRLLVEQSVDGIFLANAQGKYIDVNLAGAEMLGYSREEMYSMSIADIIVPEEIPNIPVEVARFAQGRVASSEWHFKRKDGSVFLGEVVGREVENGCLQGILRDITSRHAAENELHLARLAALNLAQDALDARFKLEKLNVSLESEINERKLALKDLEIARNAADSANRAKSEFLANMSHEIRTPMNAIIGLTQITLDSELAPKQRNHLRKVHSASKALLGILDDILDYSKIEANKLDIEQVEFVLEEVIQGCCDLFLPKLREKDLALYIEIDPLITCSLLGDPLRLGQILNNLVSNAIKFTSQGEVHIRVVSLKQDDQHIALQFSLRDSGIGLEQTQLDRLFVAFTQADSSITRQYGGTGLGLAISKRLVEMMGGSLSVTSELNVGSVFTFSASFLPGKPLNTTLFKHELRPMRVLLVDNQPTSLAVLAHYLSALNFNVSTTPNAEQAIELLREHTENAHFELLIADWHLPGNSGVELIRRVNKLAEQGELQPVSGIVMASSYDREYLCDLLNGEADFLSKPVMPSSLIDTLLGIQQPELPARIDIRERRTDLHQLAAPIRGAHILLVEDDETNQEIATEFLSRAGLRVSTANNGAQALSMVRQQVFDLILIDLHMPVMDGFEATAHIRQLPHGQKLPIVALTASAMVHEKQDSYDAGMNDHVAKPFDPVQLIKILLKWIEHKPVQPGPNFTARTAEAACHEDIPGVDYSAALSRLGGNKPLLNKLLLRFSAEQTSFPAQLEQMLHAAQFTQAAGTLHRLRGSASTLGATALAECANKIELEIRAGGATYSLPEFVCCLAELKLAIDQHILADQRDTHPHTHLELNRQMVAATLAKLKACIENQEMFDDEPLAELFDNLNNHVARRLISQFEMQLNNFDFAPALETLAEITDEWNAAARHTVQPVTHDGN